jgi:adenylate cyclase
MSNLIMEKDGMVDKYMGDAIMAIWGAPLAIENPEIKAVQTALTSLTTLKELQRSWRKKGLPKITIAIGVNTGAMKIGNFGCEKRFDYTVIGENANLASRLEGLNKTYGTDILISERTYQAIKKKIPCRYIDSIRFREKGKPVKIYEPLEVEDFKALRKEISYFEKALEVYQQREFKQARILFTTLNTRNPHKLYEVYIERSSFMSLSPPASDWDGSFSLVEK